MFGSLARLVVLFPVFFGAWLVAAQHYDNTEIQVDESKHDDEFFTFRTRPDIDAPRWKITVHDEDAVGPGFWFVAPYGIVDQTHNDQAYVAPHIYDGNGELIWSGVNNFDRYNTFAFQVGDMGDQNMLTALYPYGGKGVILNNHYETHAEVDIGTWKVDANMHEFQVVDYGTRGLYLNQERVDNMANSREVGYQDGTCLFVYNGIQERDIESGEVTFDWSAKGLIAIDESTMYKDAPVELCKKNIRDYSHLNSVDKLPSGDYLLSGRRTDTVYKITKEGDIAWRLGGHNNEFDFDGHFSGQHDVRCRFQNETHITVTMMDNAFGPGHPQRTNPYSRGLEISINEKDMTAEVLATFDHPYGGYAKERGNVQILPNGNAVIFWTDDALNSEHTPDGKVVKVAELRSGLKTYRGWKSEWVGLPSEPPAVHSELITLNDNLTTAVHVSWNGDTEVKFWNLYRSGANGNGKELLASYERRGFETPLTYPDYLPHVILEGIDHRGEKLGESDVFETLNRNGGHVSDPELEKELEWLEEHPDEESYSPASWMDEAKDIMTNPISTFVGGVLFCIAGALSAWGVWACWRNCMQRRKRKLYAALAEADESEGDAFYDKDSEELDELTRDDHEKD